MIKHLSNNKWNVISSIFWDTRSFFKGNTCRSQSLLKLYSCQRLILNLQHHRTQVQSLLPQGLLVSRGLKMTFPFKWTDSDVPSHGSEGWRRQMTEFNSLKVAESRVAFDVVLLLEAIKLSWMHIHSCQYLQIKWQKGQVVQMKEKIWEKYHNCTTNH